MKNTKRKTKKRGGIRPVFIVILIAALLLAGYAFVQLRRQAAREADPYYGMVEVFNGDDYVWITPQDGVALNDLDKSEFINDASGNLTYTGREYKASSGVDVSSYQGDIDWQQVYDSALPSSAQAACTTAAASCIPTTTSLKISKAQRRPDFVWARISSRRR